MNKALIDPYTINAGSNLGLVMPKNEKEFSNTMASVYALQVALQTMKERCHQLQQRLSVVEEENLRLRIDKPRPSNGLAKEESTDVTVLQDHIAQLTRQKSQLTHHIYMVATENKQLWTRLSKLTETNNSLGSQLTKISDTLNKHSLGESSKPNQSIQIMDSCERDVANEQKDASLEEISLKIISSIIREKMELEQQCDQMSALQSGTLSVEDCDFTLGTADTGEQEELCQDLRRVLSSLREQKEQLQKQQAGLRATVITLTSVLKHGIPCKQCKSGLNTSDSLASQANKKDGFKSETINTASTREPPSANPEDNRLFPGEVEGGNFDEDRICPLCSQLFHRTTKFDEFHEHVLTHFSDEEGDFESLADNSFQIVN